MPQNGRSTHDIAPEFEREFESDSEFEFESEPEFEGGEPEFELDEMAEEVFGETEEMELASALLEVTDEAELDQFLGKLFSRVRQRVGRALGGGVGRRLGGMLRGLARRALPILGGVAGNVIAPGVGGAVGSRLARGAGRMLGLELEGMSEEDQEFEVARRIVRVAGHAASRAARMPDNGRPDDVARASLAAAARAHAPGLIVGGSRDHRCRHCGIGQRGRWIRRGRKIILLPA